MEPVIAFALGVVACIVVQQVLEHFEGSESLRKRSYKLVAMSLAKHAATKTYADAMARMEAFDATQAPQE